MLAQALAFFPTHTEVEAYYRGSSGPVIVWAVDDDSLQKGNIPAGGRWITVHPNGKDAKGVPVLVQETKRGSGVYHVIGGAGGKLNYLKLRGLKSKEEYAESIKDKRAQKREDTRDQKKRDKELGLDSSKKKARENLKSQISAREREFISSVADTLGWDQSKIEFNPDGVADVEGSERDHYRELLSEAEEAVEFQRQSLLSDPGDVDAALDDFEQVHHSGGLGYSTKYAERADISEDDLDSEVSDIHGEGREVSADRLAKNADKEREKPAFKADKVRADNMDAIALMRAHRKLKDYKSEARKQKKNIDDSETEVKAINLTISHGADLDKKIRAEIENDIRTAKTRGFLSEIEKDQNYEKTLGRHVGVGAYGALNSASLTISGTGLIDRDVVDVLGVGNAAQVLVNRLHSDLTSDELSQARDAMELYHIDRYSQVSEDALNDAKEWQDIAAEIEGAAKDHVGDVPALNEMNQRRSKALTESKRILGNALGEMEANAAMVMALKHKPADNIEVSLGKVSAESAIQRARAIGLERGDYLIQRAGGEMVLSVYKSGIDKLAKPVSADDMAAIRDSLDIINGHKDEEGWLPLGMAKRPDLAMTSQPGVAASISEPFSAGDDMGQSIQDYIGGRVADGDKFADIYADLLSESIAGPLGDRRAEYFAGVDEILNKTDRKGRKARAEAYKDEFEAYADKFTESRYGMDRSPLHRQKIEIDEKAADSLHRALSSHPEGIAAYKAAGDLTHTDQRTLRGWFNQNIAKSDPEVETARKDLVSLDGDEPERETQDMFGTGTNPAWTEWKARRDEVAAGISAKELNWNDYVKIHGGRERAYSSLQDLIRSDVNKSFSETYNTLNPDAPIKVGRAAIRNNLNHLDAVDRGARQKRQEEHAQLVDGLRSRVLGRYSSGSVHDQIDATREAQEALEQSQMSMFSTSSTDDGAETTPLAKDERHTLGQTMENQIASMMPMVGHNFKPGQPTQLWQASMDGKYINQQRSIKLIEQNKRHVLAQGVGSGKTVIGLAGFTHLQQQGKAKRGLFVVPSIVQGQFSGEALRYLEPNKFNWHIEPGASREERIKHYKNPETHFSVVTHQAFRDDMVHMGSSQAGISKQEMSDELSNMSDKERSQWAKRTMEAEGIDYQYLMVDEGHNLLNRRGKKNSLLANVMDSVSSNTEYYVSASADPVKNDSSEIFSILRKMDPERYNDRDRFMRRYGVDTVASKEGLRREMARYFYPGRIDPGVKRDHKEINVPLSDVQKTSISKIDKAVGAARIARMQGSVDIDALKMLSPHSFEGIDEDSVSDVAERLTASLGVLKDSAVRKVIDSSPDSAKFDEVSKISAERADKPGIVFARSLASVHAIADRLRNEGRRVITITGADSSKEKAKKKRQFKPESGEPEADIIVASDAGAVGMNAQRGEWLVQVDTPLTAMTHAQRIGRIHRLGQKNNIETFDLVGDHSSERRNRERLKTKYALRDALTDPLDGLDDTGLARYLAESRKSAKAKAK